ncbi:MAG: portal protein [Alphaproteobacteria bacterium]|nr:portal protein [Alphaproteobacteria bacterium]
MSKTTDLLDRYRRLKDARRLWDAHWQDIAEVMLPQRADFTATQAPGAKRTDAIFDGTPLLAVRGLAAAIDGMVKPKTTRWFSIKASDGDLNENDAVKAWLEQVEAATFAAIYDRRAGFVQRSGEVDADLAAFGTGALLISENRTLDGLSFRSVPLHGLYLAEGEAGDIDTAFLRLDLTARQAAQRWGREKLSDPARDALGGNRPDQRFEFVHAILPRAERDPRRRDNRNLPFASIVVDVAAAHTVSESGFHEFPLAVPRWDTRTGEVYGRSPGMLALPDALTLQQMGKTILKAGQKAVDPPIIAPNDGLIKSAQLFPGGVVTYDARNAVKLGGRKPIDTLDITGNIPIGREMQQDVREQIFAAFFRNVLNLPVDRPTMTATEVIERKEEFVRTVGPVFGRLENDYAGPVAERVFAILLRLGRFPPPPPVLQGREVRFEYASPVQKVRQQIETLGAMRTVEMIAPFVQANPEIMDNFDADAIARDAGAFNGMPQRWIRRQGDVEALRTARLRALQGEEEKMDAERFIDATAKVAGAQG